MKPIITALIGFIILQLSAFGQNTVWQVEQGGNPFGFVSGEIVEKDFSIININHKNLYEVGYYGEIFKKLIIPGSIVSQIFFFSTEGEDAGEYYVYGQSSNDDQNLNFYAIRLNGELIDNGHIYFPNGTYSLYRKANPTLKSDEGQFITFSTQTIYSFEFTDSGWNIISETPHDFGIITSADFSNENYIICNSEGEMILIKSNGEVIWNKQPECEIMTVKTLQDGYIICGRKNNESTLIKTDLSGEIIWQQSYGDYIGFDVIEDSSGNFVFAGSSENDEASLVKTDANGNELWHYYFEGKVGINVIESQYGGYLLQTNERLIRTDENGIPGTLRKEGMLNVNNIEAYTNSWKALFMDENNNGHYRFPKDSLTSSIFAAGLLIGGTRSDTISISRQIYNGSTYVPGYFGSQDWLMEKVWKISRENIQFFRDDISDGEQNFPWMSDIITWPAKGNPNVCINGNTIVIENELAPFVDVNSDGIYNAYDGDYPRIKGDQMLWWVMNDTSALIEVRGSFYAYDCLESEHLVNTTFLDYEILNMSDCAIDSTYLGFWTDFDLGCAFDDYIGCDSISNSFYVYNKYDTDCFADMLSVNYGNEIPVQTVTFTNRQLHYFMVYYNDFCYPQPGTTDPYSDEELFDYLTGHWRDGSLLTYGGDGYMEEDITTHAFTGNPSNPDLWSMCTSNIPESDKRAIASSYAGIFLPGEKINFNLAFVTHPNIPHPCPDITPVIERVQALQELYDNEELDFYINLGDDIPFEDGQTIELDAGDEGIDYVWSTGETSPVITVAEAGTYSVSVTGSNGCIRSDEIVISDTNIIDDSQDIISGIKILPNPVDNEKSFLLQFSSKENFTGIIEIVNSIGQLIYRTNLKIKEGVNENTFPAPDAKGFYIIILIHDNSILMSKKLIVD